MQATGGTAAAAADASRRKVFHAGLTRDFAVLAVSLLVVGLFLIWLGFVVERTFTGRGLFLCWIGGAFLIAIFVILYHVSGCFITVTPEDITYQDRWSRTTIAWHEAADFHAPLLEQKWFRKAHLLNGQVTITVSSLSFVKFDTIMSVIRVARRSKYFNEDSYAV